MLTRFKMISTFIALLLTTTSLFAQNALEGYIAEALKNNNGIKQQQFQFDRAFEALREARTLFLPSVTMLGSYTKAAGGRTIDLPIGDLFNPVYSTLNQLTQSNSFPKIDNAAVLLNPDNFYDFKLRTAMPLINAEVYYNNKIKQQAITLQQAGVNVYKRALVKDVKSAYYQYYQSTQAIDIYKNALKLIDKNIAVNESLLRNGVRNSTALTRAQAEKQKLKAQLSQAEANCKNAAAYFNFLLNKSLVAPITIDGPIINPTSVLPKDISADNTVERREELKQL
jgi:outer membrane protein TolC